jgi:hypothetical protein
MIMGLPESIEAPSETKSEANDMVPIQKSKEKNNGSGKSLGSAGHKKEVEGDIGIDDDVALTFPQRVSNDKIMSPLGSILFEVFEYTTVPFLHIPLTKIH